jgi:hypothetical protein
LTPTFLDILERQSQVVVKRVARDMPGVTVTPDRHALQAVSERFLDCLEEGRNPMEAAGAACNAIITLQPLLASGRGLTSTDHTLINSLLVWQVIINAANLQASYIPNNIHSDLLRMFAIRGFSSSTTIIRLLSMAYASPCARLERKLRKLIGHE